MKPWVKHLRAVWFLADKHQSLPKARASFRPQLEELESREAPVALFNPLFASAFDQLDEPALPSYTVVSGYDPLPGMPPGQNGGANGTNSSQGDSSGGTGSTPTPSDNFSAGDPSAALSTMDLDANLFASVLGGDNTAFAADVAATVGANGGGAGGSGAAVVIGLPTPSAGTGQMGTPSGNTTPPAVTPGPPPALSAAPGTAETVGVGLSTSDFGLNPFTLRSGATIGALTPFVVSSGMSVPAAQSGGGAVTTGGWAAGDGSTSSSGYAYTQTTTDSYALNASESTLPDGGLSYTETYSFSYDVQTTPTSTGGATVHDWGASGYTFLATDDGGHYAFTLVATLASYEVGSQSQTVAPGDGSTSATTTTWQSTAQYDRTITNVTWASGAASGSDSGGGVATQSSTTAGAYSDPINVGVFGGVGTSNGVQDSYGGQGTSYQFSLVESRDAYGAVSQSGTWTDAGGGDSGDWYSGSGAYTIPAASGSGSGSGSASGTSTTPSISAVPDLSPVPSASGGPYASGAVLTGGGTYTESGADNSSSGYSDQYTLQNNGSWQASSGSGSGVGDGWTQTGFSGSGGYGYAVAGGSVSGSWQEGGGSETSYNESTTSTLNASGWATTGTSSSGDGGAQYDYYSGSGNYAINSVPPPAGGSGSGSSSGSGSGSGSSSGSASGSASGAVVAVSASPIPSASGGLYAPGATLAGTGSITESAGDSSGYADNGLSTLASDGSWQPATGSGWTASSGFTQWGYAALGVYGYALVGGAVAGTWQQSGSANTTYNTATNYTQSGSGDPVYTGTQANGQSGGQVVSYSGSGNYAVASGSSAYPGPDGATLQGTGAVAESGSDNWGYGYATQDAMSGDGTWLPATGSGTTTETNAAHWAYSASGTYTRPFDGGTRLAGTWQASGGSDTSYTVQSPSTLNPDGSWNTTGTATSSGSGSGHWSYSGSGNYAQSSSSGNVANGSQSSFNSQATENYAQGWSSQYTVLSTLAANGSVTTVTAASASGSASGNHAYTSSGSSSSWSQTGNYASGNGSITQSSASSGLSLTESLQSQWQEGYVITAGPTGTTTTGGASGSSQASGVASSYGNNGGLRASAYYVKAWQDRGLRHRPFSVGQLRGTSLST